MTSKTRTVKSRVEAVQEKTKAGGQLKSVEGAETRPFA